MRRTWEWVFLGILLPYRCVGCDRRFLNFFSAEASQFLLETDPPNIRPEHVKSAPNAEVPSPAEPPFRSEPAVNGPQFPASQEALETISALEEGIDTTRGGRFRVNGIRSLPKPSQRRSDGRQKSDPRVIGLQVRIGDPKWLTGTLRDASEGGIGVSVATPLAVGLTIAARGEFGESRNEQVSFVTVKWCSETMDGDFHAGLEFEDRPSRAGNDSQRLLAKTHEEFDYYEILQLSPNAEPDTIERVYRLLARRYHPHQPDTGSLEMFLKLYEAHRVLSDPEQRAEYDTRRRETKSFPGKVADRIRIR